MTIFDKVVDDSKNIPVFITESVIFGASGLLLGVIVDKQFKALSKKYPQLKVMIALAQFLVLAIFIALMFMFLRNEFALHFQQTLAGMTFPAMYFGVQSNLFDTAQSLF